MYIYIYIYIHSYGIECMNQSHFAPKPFLPLVVSPQRCFPPWSFFPHWIFLPQDVSPPHSKKGILEFKSVLIIITSPKRTYTAGTKFNIILYFVLLAALNLKGVIIVYVKFGNFCVSFMAQSTTRSCRAGQLIVALFLGRLRPSKPLTSTK